MLLADINECADPAMNQCDPNAECLNSEGSYSCECNPYYRGNGTHCEGCFCPPEIIPGTANQPAVSGHPCPCVSGFITSNNFPSLYQNSADMYWFFNMAQLSNATRQYTGIRFRVESLSVVSLEDYISFGCGTDPDRQKQFTLTQKNLNITTFHLSDCTDSWVHFHSGPNVPNTRFKIYYEMESLSLTSISTTSAVISWAPLGSVSALRGCSLSYYSIGSPSTVHTVSLVPVSTEAVIT
ncbi:uncharacterized protein LOC122546735, partial [Chiloscyllium plagiosum]|uniref:uncharacterized protein LOC122546735 n=1 Tax=Chiloscyllium plagiosum TaxID=36176 RepID=UPI001CB878A0